METDKGKERADALFDAILDDHFTGTKELSESYINRKDPDKLSKLGLLKSEQYRQAITNKKKLQKDNQTEDYILRIIDRNIMQHQKRRKEMKARFSNATRLKLNDTAKDCLERLLDALIDFAEAIVLSKAQNNMFKIMAQVQKRCQLAVQGADLLLTNGIMDDVSRWRIQQLKTLHEEMLPKEEIDVDTDQTAMLLKMLSVNTKGVHYAYENWSSIWFKSALRYHYSMVKGRPKDMIFKALQIVVFKILQGRIKERQELAANIINEAYSKLNITPLTSKDIDNALHSST